MYCSNNFMERGGFNFNPESYSKWAKQIIKTYNTISDRLCIVHSCEVNYRAKSVIEKFGLPSGYDNNLFVLSEKEDNEENITYDLHIFNFDDGIEKHKLCDKHLMSNYLAMIATFDIKLRITIN